MPRVPTFSGTEVEWRWDHFTPDEFRCKGSDAVIVDPAFMDKLETLRTTMGFPFPVSSGYRSPAYNNEVSSTGFDGPHTKGAVDILLSGERAMSVIHAAIALGFTGLGIKQHGSHDGRFIHLDALPNAHGQPRPWVWSYK